MQNIFKSFGLFLIAVSAGLAGCTVPLTKQITPNNSLWSNSSLGVASQLMDDDKMVISLTIPLR